jgi:hypothetical protein
MAPYGSAIKAWPSSQIMATHQRALVQPFSLAEFAFSPSGQGPVVESLSHSRGGHALGFCLPLFVVAIARASRCGRKCSERRECKDRDKSDRLAAPSRSHDLTRNVAPRRRDNSRRKYGEKFPRQDGLKKTAGRSNDFGGCSSLSHIPGAEHPSVALTPVPDLLLLAKDLFFAAMVTIAPCESDPPHPLALLRAPRAATRPPRRRAA